MKSLRFVVSLLVLCFGAAALAGGPTETLVGTSATALSIPPGSPPLVLVSNNGHMDIWCAPSDSTKAVVGKAQRLAGNGGSWLVPLSSGQQIYCIAQVAQVTTKATIVTGLAAAGAQLTGAFFPGGYVMSPKAPTKLSAASAGEVHIQFTRVGVCIRFSCSVSFAYLTGSSASPPVATADSNQLPATTVESFCLSQSASEDYLSIFLSAQGSCWPAERNSP